MPLARPAATESTPLGLRIRLRRKSLGLTLQAVADAAGLTAGFISQVERGLAAPSLSSLTAIARALEIGPGALFAQPPSPGTVTRHGRRPLYAIDPSGLTYERISSSFPGNQLRSVLIHEAPGHRTEPISHEGEEIFFVLAGALTVDLEGEVHVLGAGDSIHFDSRRVHSTWNHTQGTTTILHICTMDVFGDATRNRTGGHGNNRPSTGS
jgi:transcriptional regulator with XRE-family HTH domain